MATAPPAPSAKRRRRSFLALPPHSIFCGRVTFSAFGLAIVAMTSKVAAVIQINHITGSAKRMAWSMALCPSFVAYRGRPGDVVF